MAKTPLYSDKHIVIFKDRLRFKSLVLSWGKKDVMFNHIKKISERKMGLFSGRLQISGSNNFRDWFYFDATRPAKNKAIVLETDYKIYKRLWITPERHSTALNILRKII
ncbi:MAG: hypothetical protein ACW9W4_01485 [Candidatus Nitrosopumilus sp. bin_7KS]